jgi:hypothetical protein
MERNMSQNYPAKPTGGTLVNGLGNALTSKPFWTLNKIIILVLTGAFLGLVFDLRFEHVDKVRHHWTAWIPIVYSGVMVVACIVGLYKWQSFGREMLFYCFAVGLLVGLLGFWFHNSAHVVGNVAATFEAWTKPEHHPDAPPVLAPLAFCGLGVFGMIACSVRECIKQ